jgi:hypothetical protein
MLKFTAAGDYQWFEIKQGFAEKGVNSIIRAGEIHF